MTRQTKRKVVAASGVVALVTIAIWWWLFRTVSSGPVYAPPEWANELRPVQLKVAVAEDALLIRRGSATFRYDPTANELKSVSDEQWVATEGIETACEPGGMPPDIYLDGTWQSMDEFHKKLDAVRKRGWRSTFSVTSSVLVDIWSCASRKPSNEVSTCVDAYLREYGQIPPVRMVTVSAGGILEGQWISVPFITSAPTTSQSQHYAQFVTIPEGKSVGPTLRIPFVTDLGSQPPRPGRDYLLGGCFSHDSRFLIFHGAQSLVVIDVPEVLGEKR